MILVHWQYFKHLSSVTLQNSVCRIHNYLIIARSFFFDQKSPFTSCKTVRFIASSMILDTISNPRLPGCKLNNDTLIASTRYFFIIRIQCYFVAKNHQKFFWSDFQTNQLDDVCRLMVLISIDKSFSFCLTYLR